jgi:DNA-binding MurR/RpiR family transcriptional regulator
VPYQLCAERRHHPLPGRLGQNIAHIINNLQKTDSGVDRERFMNTARMLADGQTRVFIMGQRTSFGLAHTLWIPLRYLREGLRTH